MFPYIVVITILLISWLLRGKPSNVPPGPRGIPMLGYLPFVDKQPYLTIQTLAKKYGDIFSMYLGNHLVVVINSYDLIRQAFQTQGMEFNGRPEHQLYEEDEETNFFYADGEMWTDYRRFGTSMLRDFGMGKTALEPILHDETHELVSTLKAFVGKPTDIRKVVNMAANNIGNMILFGHRFEYNDKKYLRFQNELDHYTRAFRIVLEKFFNPFNLQRLKEKLGIVKVKQESHPIVGILSELIKEELEQIKPDEAPNFIKEWMDEYERRGPYKGKHLTANHLTLFITAIYAGFQNVGNTTLWSIMYLMQYPDLQKRLQKELDVVGFDTLPSLNNIENLPYVAATLHECDRVRNIFPLGMNHMTVKSTELGGYNIPKGTVVMANLWSVHNDSEIFKNPSQFDPERYINTEGKVIKPPQLIPFSIGSRRCPGEIISRMMLFLTLTAIFKNFTLKVPEGDQLRFDHGLAIQAIPQPFQVILEPRY